MAEDIERIDPADLWGLSEVKGEEDAQIFQSAISSSGVNYGSVLSGTGGSDRLQIVFNPQRLRLIQSQELSGFGGTRSPLVAQFEFLPNRQQFFFTVNHFNRREPQKRELQARNLRKWAQEQVLPVIAAGDYNFDVSPKTKQGNDAFSIFMDGDTFTWIEPQCLANGTCPSTGTQCNPKYDSILDFVFLSGAAKQWQGESQILFQDQPVCEIEKEGHSDHYPVAAQIAITSVTAGVSNGTSTGNLSEASTGLRIAALLPNPAGDEVIQEAATIANSGQSAIDLTGWQLRDRFGQRWRLDVLGTLQPGEQQQIRREGQEMALNNDGDTVELVSPQGEIIDTVAYDRAAPGQQFSFN